MKQIPNGYRVEVWHATGTRSVTVADNLNESEAFAKAREYVGADAKAIEVRNRSGFPVKGGKVK